MRTLSFPTATIVSTISSPKHMHSASRRDKINTASSSLINELIRMQNGLPDL